MAIMNSGGMSWATTGPPGPVFGVTYPESAMLTTTTEGGMVRTLTNSAAATNGGDAIFQNVSNSQRPSISKRAIAAAVVVPIIVISEIVAVALRFWRQREAEKRRRWSQALSSTSNLDWEKGARAGERTGSMFGPGRPSMSSYGHPRASMAASSVFGENMAGAGAAGAGAAGTMRQTYMRNVSNDALNPNPRPSRISFAESARPERGDRRSRMSLGNDLRPHSAVFTLKPGSRSASDLPASNLGPGAQGSPSPSKSSRLRGLQGSAIADDDEGSVIGKGGRRGSAGSDGMSLSLSRKYKLKYSPPIRLLCVLYCSHPRRPYVRRRPDRRSRRRLLFRRRQDRPTHRHFHVYRRIWPRLAPCRLRRQASRRRSNEPRC